MCNSRLCAFYVIASAGEDPSSNCRVYHMYKALIAVPRAAVRARPLKDIEVVVGGCPEACPPVP